MTFGQWRAQMSSQVAAESSREYYDLKSEKLRLENEELKEELLKLKKENALATRLSVKKRKAIEREAMESNGTDGL